MAERLSYTIPEAAAAVGVSERTIRQHVKEGTLAARYVGTKPLIPARELEEWLDALPSEKPGRGR